jgi:hypothetical protein
MGVGDLEEVEEGGMGCRLQTGGVEVVVHMDWEDMDMVEEGPGRGIEQERCHVEVEEVDVVRFCMV